MKIFSKILWCAASLALLPACTEDEYKLYDTTQKDSVFFEYRNDKDELVEELEYAFNYDISDTHTVEIPITLMGVPKDYERVVNVVPVAEESDMTEGINYTITNNVIAANAVSGTVHINLLRDDPEIQEMEKSVKFTISESDDLKPVGDNSFTITYSDIRPTLRPDWWSPWGAKPIYSYENAQLFFDYFYRLAPEANINIFDEMILAYGDYFVKAGAQKGPFVMYETFLRQYVLIPLYNDHPDIGWYGNPNW